MKKNLILLIGILFLLAGDSREVVMAKTKEIQLSQPKTKSGVSLEEAIIKRRSVRDFIAKDLSEEETSQLLWAAQGITAKSQGRNLRSVPSAGALYPIELYLLNKDGLFHYIPEGHKLEVLSDKDVRSDLSAVCLGQSPVRDAAVDIVICGVSSRITSKYGERGVKYMYVEAGHIAQNIHLEAVALGLGSVPIGAFSDKEVDRLLNLPIGSHALYIIPVGHIE